MPSPSWIQPEPSMAPSARRKQEPPSEVPAPKFMENQKTKGLGTAGVERTGPAEAAPDVPVDDPLQLRGPQDLSRTPKPSKPISSPPMVRRPVARRLCSK